MSDVDAFDWGKLGRARYEELARENKINLSERQLKLVAGMWQGRTKTEAARLAGYSPEKAAAPPSEKTDQALREAGSGAAKSPKVQKLYNVLKDMAKRARAGDDPGGARQFTPEELEGLLVDKARAGSDYAMRTLGKQFEEKRKAEPAGAYDEADLMARLVDVVATRPIRYGGAIAIFLWMEMGTRPLSKMPLLREAVLHSPPWVLEMLLENLTIDDAAALRAVLKLVRSNGADHSADDYVGAAA